MIIKKYTWLLLTILATHTLVFCSDDENDSISSSSLVDASTQAINTTQNAPLECDGTCGEIHSYEKPDSLRKHYQRKHLQGNNYNCPIQDCPKQQDLYQLKQHIITHHFHTKTLCFCTGCNERFTTPTAVYQHIKKQKKSQDEKHTDAKIDQSEYNTFFENTFSFKNKTTFKKTNICRKQHYIDSKDIQALCSPDANGKIDMLICPCCNKKHRSRELLENHIRKHTGDKPFSCSACQSKFSTKSSASRHIKLMQNNESEKDAHENATVIITTNTNTDVTTTVAQQQNAMSEDSFEPNNEQPESGHQPMTPPITLQNNIDNQQAQTTSTTHTLPVASLFQDPKRKMLDISVFKAMMQKAHDNALNAQQKEALQLQEKQLRKRRVQNP